MSKIELVLGRSFFYLVDYMYHIHTPLHVYYKVRSAETVYEWWTILRR